VSTTTQRMPLAQAQPLAEALVKDLAPGCTRIEIAGSIRRRKPDVGDIEIVAIPAERPKLIVGLPIWPLEELLEKQERDGLLVPLKGGRKLRQFFLPHSAINLELHLCTPSTWGLALVIWTGPQEFSKRVVTKRCLGGLLPDHLRINGLHVIYDRGPDHGRIFRRGTPAPDHGEEADVFRLLGIRFVQPWER
jgi:DNA polymerase/3'-5' exonuclease PolX